MLRWTCRDLQGITEMIFSIVRDFVVLIVGAKTLDTKTAMAVYKLVRKPVERQDRAKAEHHKRTNNGDIMETTITCPRCDEDYAASSFVKHFPCKCEVCFHCVLQQLQVPSWLYVHMIARLVCHCGVEVSKHEESKPRWGEANQSPSGKM